MRATSAQCATRRSWDPTTPHVRVDKQCIEFAFFIGSRFHRGKSDNRSSPFRHKYPTCGDLRDRQLDGVRVGEQGFAITGIGKGCPQLQVLKLLLFGGNCPTNQKILHNALSYIVAARGY